MNDSLRIIYFDTTRLGEKRNPPIVTVFHLGIYNEDKPKRRITPIEMGYREAYEDYIINNYDTLNNKVNELYEILRTINYGLDKGIYFKKETIRLNELVEQLKLLQAKQVIEIDRLNRVIQAKPLYINEHDWTTTIIISSISAILTGYLTYRITK